ncbi:MAG: hypothetical protein K8R88_06515 [Armatimonadetes bacterium]|nr:hypothetical protein [Armatimonadota bacterium]
MSEEAEPWDIPRSPESRDKLKSLGDDFRAEGKLREAGICYSRLAGMLKWVPFDDQPAFQSALNYGIEAVELLRQTDDKAELATALRVTPTIFHPNRQAILEESLSLARECGARAEEAWTLMQLASPNNCEFIEEAIAIFEELGDKHGIAVCSTSLGMKMPKPRDSALFERAINLYKELGDEKAAERAATLMEMFCRPIGAYSTPLQAQRKLRRYVRQYKSGPKKIDKVRLKLNLRKPDAS